MLNCPTCSSANPDGARFCNQCGARLDAAPARGPDLRSYTPKHLADRILRTRAAMQGERKRVTVLFCDIKGSTRLAQEAGAEAWHAILDRFFSILANAVHRYEGTVNQYTGDGIMALFGAPVAHEDHGQRACFAALEMQREVRRFADELRLSKGLNLSMRIGLNTGEVIVGRIGDDLRMDYTAQGVTVNLAARMEHICEPGRIYLSRYTARLVEGYFRLRDLGPMSVAGVDEPVEVYELEGEGALRTRLDRSLARGGSPFIGRDRELNQLLAALERVRGGEGQIVAVVGNAGIGKSRLCHEFAQACERAGVAVHRATGVPYANAVPLHPVRQLARSRLGISDRASAQDIRRMVAGTFLLNDPASATILPVVFDFLGAGEGGGLPPDQAARARARMFEMIADYLPCCDEQPQLLLVEDLHFLDSASEEFLAALCAKVRNRRTLLLVNYRPDYVNEWLLPHLDEQIAVSALTGEQLDLLACNLLGPDASLEGVARRIRERASGNPFFVEEAVQALAEAGHLEGERGSFRLARRIDEWPIPETVHALLAARIDRLPDRHKSLLQTAAVIGQEFPQRLLASMSEEGDDPFDAQLAVLEDSGFVHHRRGELDDAEYAFCHPLMQEVAYHGQLESRRAEAHARLARQMEAQHPLSGPPCEAAVRLAHHWQLAGDWGRAGAWNLLAARWLSSRDGQSTVEQFRRAVQNFDRAPDSAEVHRQRIAARSGLIRSAQFWAMPTEQIDQAYAEARAMAEQCGDAPCEAELKISYGNELLHRGDAKGAAELSADAVKVCVDNGLQALITRFRLSILLTHNAAGMPREGIALVDEGGSDWRTRPVDEDNFMSRGFYGVMLGWLGRFQEGEASLRGAIEWSAREARSASWMHAFLVDLGWYMGDWSNALAEARNAREHAEEFGSPFFRAIAVRAMGMALCLNGQPAEAIPMLEEARPLVDRGGLAHQLEANFLATLAQAYHGAGRLEDAERTANEGIASAQRSGSRVWEIAAWFSLLRLPVTTARRPRAIEGIARIQTLIESSGVIGFLPWMCLAQAHWAQDESARAGFQAQALEHFARIGAHAHVKRRTTEL